jgi:hypothetical protein
MCLVFPYSQRLRASTQLNALTRAHRNMNGRVLLLAYIQMCVCMYVSYAYTYIYLYTLHIYVYIHTRILKCTYIHVYVAVHVGIEHSVSYIELSHAADNRQQTDRQTDRKTDRQTDRQTQVVLPHDNRPNKRTYVFTYTHTHRERERERERETWTHTNISRSAPHTHAATQPDHSLLLVYYTYTVHSLLHAHIA